MDITPFVGSLVDGAPHSLTFSVGGAAEGSFWVVEGSLHVWLDPMRQQTRGETTVHKVGDVDWDGQGRGRLTKTGRVLAG